MFLEDTPFDSYDKAEHKAYKAFELYENGCIPQALLELDAALEMNPCSGSLHFNKALALDAANRFEDAIAEYEIALQSSPLDLEILNSVAIDYTRIGQYDLAISTFERIEEIDPDFEPCYCNRIITYTEMGLHESAEQMFYLAQLIDPDCALCYYNIGNSLFASGQYKKAVHCWLKTAGLDPSHPEINYRIAQAYWADGNKDLAREHFLTELRLNPGYIDVILDFGLFLLEAGDIESAKEKFNRILELTPGSAVATFYLGEIAFDSGDYERAIQLFNQAIQKDDTLPGPRYRLAQYALLKGHPEEAKDFLIPEMRLASEDVDVLVSMGSMFLTIGEYYHAANCFLRAIDIDCASADAYYYLGLANALNERLEDAAEFFGHALDLRPNDIIAIRDSAIVCLAMGRMTEASERIKRALDLAQHRPDRQGDYSRLKVIEHDIQLARKKEQILDFLNKFRP
jgi:tetratricopeptide (TPR) repeat protein